MIFRYSLLDSFLQCPMKFKKAYVDLEREDSKSSALEFGSAMHAALRAHFDGLDSYTIFNMYWDSLKDKHLEYDRFSWEDLRAMANEAFLPNFLRMHSKKFTNVKVEEELTMPFLGEHTFQGTYDLCSDYEGVLTMVDYKTSAREYSPYKLHRNPQMYIYAELYRQKYNVMPKQVMYKVFIKSERRIQTLKCDLTEEKLNAMMKNVEAIGKQILKMIESGGYYSNYNCFCSNPRGCFP